MTKKTKITPVETIKPTTTVEKISTSVQTVIAKPVIIPETKFVYKTLFGFETLNKPTKKKTHILIGESNDSIEIARLTGANV